MSEKQKKTTSEMTLVDIEKLVPYANNARTHSKEQINKLRSSLREFGFINPVIIDRDYGVIAGHGRIMAAKEEGIAQVPCVFVDHLTEAQKKAYILADNRMAMDAGWDEKMLKVELEALQGYDFDMSLTGFDEKELEKYMGADETADDEFDVDEAYEKPHFSKPGDLWMLGRHKVLCGNSTVMESFDTLLGNEKVNLVLTDLPYFVSYKGKAGTIRNDDLNDEEAYQFSLKTMNCMHETMAKDASIYVFHSDSKGLIFRRAFHDAGFYLSSCCIWEKDSLVLGRSPYQWISESILYGWRADGKHNWYAGRSEVNVWHFPKPKKNVAHPTCKPVPLMAYPMKNSTQTNGIVLDPFLGSGSTMIACEETGRICRGIELDSKYMDVIVRRWTQYKQGNWGDVICIRDGKELTLEEVVALMDEPCDMRDFVDGVEGGTAE